MSQKKSNLIRLTGKETASELILKATEVVPSQRQINWQKTEVNAFLHFGMNTFTDREWGDGTDAPETFAPTQIDAEQWAEVVNKAGFGGIILTCKHHDGFCLWPSAYTDYSVKKSPWLNGEGDVVRLTSESCKKYGLKFGVYLSPWDRHDARYGDSPAYNEYFLNQLRELLTGYGEIFEVWFDGACAEGSNGKRQEYDWKAYFDLIRELQPNAAISIMGPDVRWVGNEAGKGREAEWSVLPGKIRDEDACFADSAVDAMSKELGTEEVLANCAANGADCLFWSPAQVDTSIRPGWFYHTWEDYKVKSLYELVEIYTGSVGGNAQLLLNVPPNREGRISCFDADRLIEFGEYIKEMFREDLTDSYSMSDEKTLNISLRGATKCNCLVLSEDIRCGQRVSEFSVTAVIDGSEQEIACGKTIGYKKIVKFDTILTGTIKVVIKGSRATPKICAVSVYRAPAISFPPVITRDPDGYVSVRSGKEARVYYSVDDGAFQPYTQPFCLPRGGAVTVKAEYAYNHLHGSSTIVTTAVFGIVKNKWKTIALNGSQGIFPEIDKVVTGRAPFVALDQKFPCDFVIDLGKTVAMRGVGYLPISDIFDFSCNVYKIAIEVSTDGAEYQEQFCGTLDNIKNNPILRELIFDQTVPCRYLKFKAYSGFDKNRIGIGSIDVLI